MLKTSPLPHSANGGAFEKCASLKNIFFDSTVTEWQALVFDKNGDRWDIDSGNYIVHCSDGKVNK